MPPSVPPISDPPSSAALNLRSNPLLEPGLLLGGDVVEMLRLLARQNGVTRTSLWRCDPGQGGVDDARVGEEGSAVSADQAPHLELLGMADEGAVPGSLLAAERTAVEGGVRGGVPALIHASTAAGMQTVLVFPFFEDVEPTDSVRSGIATREVSFESGSSKDQDADARGADALAKGSHLGGDAGLGSEQSLESNAKRDSQPPHLRSGFKARLALAMVVTVAPRLDAWLPLMRAAADALIIQRKAAVLAAERAAVRAALDQASATVELFTRAAEAPDFIGAGRVLMEELQRVVGGEMGILCRKTWRGLRTLAITGGADVQRRGEVHDLAEIIAGIAVRESSRVSWGQGVGSGYALEAALVREVERVWGACRGVAEPFLDGSGRVVGAWIFIWSPRMQPDPGSERFLDAVRPHVGVHLALMAGAKPGPARGAALRWWRSVSVSRRKTLQWAAAIGVGVLLWPVRYPVKARSELEPEFSRTVAVPFDSLLRKARVRAGQTVAAGDVLAEMDGRELRWQLAEALAKKARASKEAEKAVTEGEIASARLAELEMASWGEQVRLLEYRRDNLQVRTPSAGVVVSGDLDRAEGTPLRTGDPLYEVAVLDRMRLRMSVPDVDVVLVKEGQKVRVRFDSDPGRVWEATVSRVSPRSEILENRNVFVSEAVLDNQKLLLRPGMKGRAVVSGPFRPLIWRWTRNAWNAVRMVFW